jgi:hypothetical protein
VPPYTLRLVSGALPDGLTLPPVGGIRFFQGAPTKQGTFTFTLGASDAENPPATTQQNMTLRVDAPLTMLSGSPLPRGVVGQPYTFQFQASGGVAPLHWTLANSSQLAGLSVDANTGRLMGTPTQAFTGVITVQVTDSANPPQQLIDPMALQITQGP